MDLCDVNLVGGGVSENQQSLNRLEQGNTQDYLKFCNLYCTILWKRFLEGCSQYLFTKPTTLNKWLNIMALFGYMHDPMLSKYILCTGIGIILAYIYNNDGFALLDVVHMCYNAWDLFKLM